MIWSIFHYIFLNIEPGEKQFLYASIEARSSIFAIRAFSQNEGQSKKKNNFFSNLSVPDLIARLWISWAGLPTGRTF